MNKIGWMVQIIAILGCLVFYHPLSMISCGLASSLSIYISVFENDRRLMVVSLINTCWMIVGGFVLLSYTI